MSKNCNGANELWDKDVTKCVAKTEIKFNRAIIFKTNDISWHGLPEKIMCPENVFRKSLAYYYVSPLNAEKSEKDYRKKLNLLNVQKIHLMKIYKNYMKSDHKDLLLKKIWKK
jgi:hypothetical protein